MCHPDASNHVATIDVGRKWGLLCPFPVGGRDGSPSNTMSPWPRPTSVPSGILIHLTDWPQYTNATDRTGRTDNGPIGQGKPLYKRSPKNPFVDNSTTVVKSGFASEISKFQHSVTVFEISTMNLGSRMFFLWNFVVHLDQGRRQGLNFRG